MGLSGEASVRSRVRLGILREYRDDRGKARYDANEVDRLTKKRPAKTARAGSGMGAVAGIVFRRLRDGHDPITIIAEEDIDPDVFEECRSRFDAYKGLVSFAGSELTTLLDRLDVAVRPPTVEALLDGLARYDEQRRRERDADRTRHEAEGKALHEQLGKSSKALEQSAATVRDLQEALARERQARAELEAKLAAPSPAPPAAPDPKST